MAISPVSTAHTPPLAYKQSYDPSKVLADQSARSDAEKAREAKVQERATQATAPGKVNIKV